MEQEILKYGIPAFLAYILIRDIIVPTFRYFTSGKNGNKKDNRQDIYMATINERLKAIETNHLPHIEARLQQNDIDHKEILVGITKIKSKLGIE